MLLRKLIVFIMNILIAIQQKHIHYFEGGNAMRDYYDDPIFEDDLAGMEDFDYSEDDADEELYEEYIDEYGDRYRFF